MTEPTHTVTIEALIAGGRGRAVLDGMQVFVPWTVPGDQVRIVIRRQHRGYCEAEVVEILQPSPARVTPPCPVFGVCGGCQWQHIAYATQVEWKQRIVQEQLRRLGGIAEATVLPIIPADTPWHYRSRIQLQVDAQQRIGFYRAGTHDVVEFAACAIADERLNARLVETKEQMRRDGKGRVLRLDDAEGFAQVNVEQNHKLRQLLREGVAARGGGAVVELYAGSGNLTFPIADVARSVLAVDDDARGIARGQQTAREKGLTHVTFVCTSAARLMQRLQETAEPIDGVILDPPRRGAAEVMASLIALRPQWIGYVSCDPATLARDVKTLLAGGYRHISSQPIDMFPQTFHIESLTWLERSS